MITTQIQVIALSVVVLNLVDVITIQKSNKLNCEQPIPPRTHEEEIEDYYHMKATLEFNLPDDEQLFRAAVNAERVHLVIWSLAEFLRYKINKDEAVSEEQEKVYQDVSNKFFELLDKYNVDPNEIE